MKSKFNYLTVCIFSVMLTACGGGGGSDNSSTNQNPIPNGGGGTVGSENPINPGDGTNELPGDGSDSNVNNQNPPAVIPTPTNPPPTLPPTAVVPTPPLIVPTPPSVPPTTTTPVTPTPTPVVPTPPSVITPPPVPPTTTTPVIPAPTPVVPTPPSVIIPPPIPPITTTPVIPAPTPVVPTPPSVITPPPVPVVPVSKYPEPKKNLIDRLVLGFYDYDKNGQTRLIRNDLNGNFSAMIQFAQSHVVNPKNNEAGFMPRLTSEKEALLLVTPIDSMGDLQTLNAEIYQNNQLIRTVKLKEPSRLALSDQANTDGRPSVLYSKRAWSVALNWNEVRPGLYIRVVDSENNRSGTLTAEEIDFAAPGEMVIHNIRLGMLTNPVRSNGHYMLLEPARAGTDYFQTIPAARMVVTQYEDVRLDRVMVANGTIYDSVSATTGDIYSGDMRENTAKSTFAVGINLANWGVTSASMASQEQPQVTQSTVVNHARGKYSNGEANHGLSGGNSILSLIDSVGNEFSHEIGHHYGLGHYPGEKNGNYFWAAHHADSGWGYMSFRNRMRGNLNWWATNLGDGSNGVPNFLNLYGYSWDAMSGGSSASSISRYTHYTGYSTQQKIQPALNRYVWDKDAATGYKKWNAQTRMMEVSQPTVPRSNNVWYNSTDGNFLKPVSFGVPIYTVLGGYDPVQQKGVIYPAARGNWGNVFNLPQANTSLNAASCWLTVQSNRGTQHIALAPNRLNGNANKFHINFAQAEQPSAVDLYCKKANEDAVKLSSISISPSVDALPAAVSIGKEDGYSALRKIELPQLEAALLANQGKQVVNLSPTARLLFDSYRLFKDELSLDAQEEMVRFTQQQIKLYRLNRWVNVYKEDLVQGVSEAIDAFKVFVGLLELNDDLPTVNTSLLKNGSNCLKVEKLENGRLNAFISGQSECAGDETEQWVFDAIGKIHSKAYMDQCLTTQSDSVINLSPCTNSLDSQVWQIPVNSNQIKQVNQCFDLEGGFLKQNRARLIRWSCNGGNNQKWTSLVQNNSLILSANNAQNLPLISKLLTRKE